jgi:GT2 family glycosyltransferase
VIANIAHPTVLVVVPTLGSRPEWLGVCLRSVAMQDYPCVQIRVVGPSGRGIESITASFGAQFLSTDEPGLSKAINYAWWADGASQELITWLGDDDALAPGSISKGVTALRENPLAGMCYGRTRYIDDRGNSLYLSRPSRFASVYLRIGKDFVPQPGSILRRVAVSSVGSLDESLRNAMDLDLFIRLQKWGPAVYVKAELSAYRLHGESITATKGLEDEARQVRQRHRGVLLRTLLRPLEGPIALLDRIVYACHMRLPCPPTPQLGGVPYTMPPQSFGRHL